MFSFSSRPLRIFFASFAVKSFSPASAQSLFNREEREGRAAEVAKKSAIQIQGG